MSPSLTYTGSGYAHYTLTELGAGEMRSTYQDYVSLSLRTVQSEAVLFSMQDKSGSEYLHIQVCMPALHVTTRNIQTRDSQGNLIQHNTKEH